MNDADPLRALCRRARRSEDPDEASRRALSRRLASKGLLPAAAGGLLLATNLANAASAVGASAATKTSLAALAICVASGVGGGLLLGAGAAALGELPRASSGAVVASAAAVSGVAPHRAPQAAAPPEALVPATPLAASSTPASLQIAAVATASVRVEGAAKLAAETRDLLEAQRALRDQNPTLALELLERQARAHDRGVLSAERQAARVLALCAAGRSTQAKTERERFLALYPSSPLVGRVRESCDGR